MLKTWRVVPDSCRVKPMFDIDWRTGASRARARRRVAAVFLTACVAGLMIPGIASAREIRLIVGFTPSADTPTAQRAVFARSRLRTVSTRSLAIGRQRNAVVVVNAVNAASALRSLARTPGVAWAEVDHVAHANWNPGDPRLSGQWGMSKIDAFTAWNFARGNGVKIAIVDTGVDYTHADLSGRVDKGWDFVDSDADPMDVQGHGTHVAGIAAGTAGNGVGGAGVAPGARILAVRALDSDGSGYYSWIAHAIAYATDNGAQVINLSLGGSEDSQALRQAVGYAASRGVVVACASGNDGATKVGVPARYDGCISVGSSGKTDLVSAFSNRGSGLDVVAPGEGILSTVMGNGYEAWDGTSMATPYVSGLAALLASQGQSARRISDTIRGTATDLSPRGWDRVSGFGRIDAAAAVQAAAARGAVPADVVAPSIANVDVSSPRSTPRTVTQTAWKRIASTSYRFVGYSPDFGSYDWEEVKTRGQRRTIYAYRARYGVVRRKTTIQQLTRVPHTTYTVTRTITPVLAQDNVGIDRVSLEIDGSWVATDWNGSNGWGVSWQCRTGTHTFTLNVFDEQDNRAAASTQETITC